MTKKAKKIDKRTKAYRALKNKGAVKPLTKKQSRAKREAKSLITDWKFSSVPEPEAEEEEDESS